jgi:hypothetical protein
MSYNLVDLSRAQGNHDVRGRCMKKKRHVDGLEYILRTSQRSENVVLVVK